MRYALQTLWYERRRFFPAIVAVTFSALLAALEGGLTLGLFSSVSLAIDRTNADVWVGSYQVASVDQGQPIPARHLARLAGQPEVKHCEIYLQGRGLWVKPGGAAELCMILGSRLERDSLGAVNALTPELKAQLTEPGTVVVDQSDLGRLGISGVGATAKLSDQNVRVVGLVRGFHGLANAYVFCSVETARSLLHLASDETIYLLARCHRTADAPAVVERLSAYSDLSAFTNVEFSRQSRLYWLTKTKAGLALGWTAVLGLFVGAVVTGQTLYSATAASVREYAVLRALGIPRWRMAAAVVLQCLLLGVAGVAVAFPALYGLASLAGLAGATILLPAWLLAGMALVTVLMAGLSGLAALRLVLRVEPVLLLR